VNDCCQERLFPATVGAGQATVEQCMDQKKVFWLVFIVLGTIADIALPLLWAVLATIPIIILSWWIAYRSDWF
jgi:hypothetical protein